MQPTVGSESNPYDLSQDSSDTEVEVKTVVHLYFCQLIVSQKQTRSGRNINPPKRWTDYPGKKRKRGDLKVKKFKKTSRSSPEPEDQEDEIVDLVKESDDDQVQVTPILILFFVSITRRRKLSLCSS